MSISKSLTGHTHFRSAYESDNSCGTCDGGRCEFCSVIYTVSTTGETFHDLEEAKAADDAATAARDSLIPVDRKSYYEPDDNEFFVKDGKLYVELYMHSVGTYGERQDVLCNEASTEYATKLKDATERMDKYLACKCINKAEVVDGSPCSKFGCVDSRCHYEMKHKGRTEKKWYM